MNNNRKRTNNKNNRKTSVKGNKYCKDNQTREERDGSKERELHNDPNWYFTSAEIADQASTFSFNEFIGTKITLPTSLYSPNTYQDSVESELFNPSILVLDINPSPGIDDLTTPQMTGVNLAAVRNYNMISSRNGKTTQYAPQDITMLILAMGEVISIVEFLRRAFGVMYTYNQRNRVLPRKLIESMGIYYDDFSKNIADYRLQLNTLITGINKIPFPTNIAYIYKCMDMYQRIYLDSDTPMASIVYRKPYSTWILDEASDPQGSVLKTTALGSFDSKWNMSRYLDTLNDMITALTTSSTMNFIYADLLMLRDKYSLPLMVLDYVSMDYAVIPEFNLNFMLQVHNSNAVGVPQSGGRTDYFNDKNDVVSRVDTNTVYYQPYFTATDGDQFMMAGFIDMPVGNPDVVSRIEATRYMAIPTIYKWTSGSGASAAEVRSRVYAMPDHYVVQYELFVSDGDSTNHTIVDNNIITDASAYNLAFAGINMGPIFFYLGSSSTLAPLSAVDFFTQLPYSWASRVNDLTMLALFEIR